MRTIRHSATFTIGLTIALIGLTPAYGQGIFLDHVDGLDPDGHITQGATLTFHMRVVGDATNHLFLNNGFTITTKGVDWGNLSGEYNPSYPLDDWFLVNYVRVWSDGYLEDTIGFCLYTFDTPGLPAGFDDILYSITVGPFHLEGPITQYFVLDSSYLYPLGAWQWDVVGENVAWGGPYEFELCTCGFPPYTYCEPQPTYIRDLDRILRVHILYEDPDSIIWESVRVQRIIPPLDGYPIMQDGHLVTACRVMHFIGVSGFRPLSDYIDAQYTVEYDKTDGTHTVVTGDYELCPGYCEKYASDHQVNLDDIVFAVDYLWRGGDTGEFYEEEINAIMDIDGNGRVDAIDVIMLIESAGFE